MPAAAIDMIIDVTAELLCMIPVTIIPTSKRRKGFSTLAKAFVTTSLSRKNLMESDINCKPKNISPKPHMRFAAAFVPSFLANIAVKAPTLVNAIANDMKSKVCSAAICAVIVVPMLAPMIIVVA